MLKNKIVELFTSLYIFNIVIVRKKDEVSEEINRILMKKFCMIFIQKIFN